MKLNKLLPIVALSGIATIATPLVVSCGSNGGNEKTMSWNYMNGEYVAKYDSLPSDSLTTENAISKYYEEITKDPLIFADDFLLGNNVIYNGFIQVVNFTCANSEITIKDINAEKQTLSYRMTMDFEGKMKASPDTSVWIKSDLLFENIPYTLTYVEDEESNDTFNWNLESPIIKHCSNLDDFKNFMNNYSGWSMKGFVESRFSGEVLSTVDFNESKLPTAEQLGDIHTSLDTDVISHFMQNISCDDPV